MNILLLSTSGRAASAALSRDGVVLSRAVSDNGLTHSETIMPLIDSLFAPGNTPAFDEIDAFAADIGPGSFTGVRIGVCIANAFGAATGKPVAPVSSLEALARAASESEAVCAVIDARHGNCYAAVYRGREAIMPPTALTVAELLKKVPENVLFTGSGAAVYGGEIKNALPRARFADASLHMLTADMLASPAFETLSCSSGQSNQKEIMPLYLRPSQAERLYKEK